MYTAVLDFLDQLSELPRDAWLAIGRAVRADTDRLAALSSARAILDATITDAHLALAAWHVKDAVETSMFVARHAAGRLSAWERVSFHEAQAAAEEAALAVLARPHLSDADFEVLYAPFARRGSERPAHGAAKREYRA